VCRSDTLTLPVLLFVLWYCHKRGREVRLEEETRLSQEEVTQSNANDEASSHPSPVVGQGVYEFAAKDRAPADMVSQQ
jgi:hypothetical protein